MSQGIPVAHIAERDLLKCPPDVPLVEAARRMCEAHCSSVVVHGDGVALGIWTERDAVDVDFSHPEIFDIPISEVMSKPIMAVPGSLPVGEVGIRFDEEGIRHFLVTDDDGDILGIVSQTDVILHQGVEHFLYLRDVGTAMRRPLVSIPGDASLNDAAERMRVAGRDAALVKGGDGAEPGIITQRDLVHLIAQRKAPLAVSEVASRPLVTVSHATTLIFARNLLVREQIRHVAVLGDGDEIVGLLSFADIMRCIQTEYANRLEQLVRQREEELERSVENLHLARKVIDASPDAVMILSADGHIETVTPAFAAITGFEAGEVVGKRPSICTSGRHPPDFYEKIWNTVNTVGYWQGEVWNCRKGGDVYAEWLSVSVIRDDTGAVHRYAATFRDITARKEHLRNLAYYDPLTGLPNRILFNDRLLVAMARAHRHDARLAILYLDLDGFKPINDAHGHPIGDKVLQEIGSRLSECIRDADSVARLHGDEFSVLLPEITHRDDVGALAQRILDHLAVPITAVEEAFRLSASIGIAVYPDHGDTPDTLMARADEAMYRAKGAGRNRYHLYAEGTA